METTPLSPCSHQAMIQLVTPGPRLAKCCVKNRGIWEGALIIWIYFFFPEVICIIARPPQHWLGSPTSCCPQKGLRFVTWLSFLPSCVNGIQTMSVIPKRFPLSERVKPLGTRSNPATVVQPAAEFGHHTLNELCKEKENTHCCFLFSFCQGRD